MEPKKEWEQPLLTTHGSAEELTAIKQQGGFDGVQIQLSSGVIVTGS